MRRDMAATSVLPAGIAEPFGPSQWGFVIPPTYRDAPNRDPRKRPNTQHFVHGLFEDALRHHREGRIGHAVTRYKRALALRPDYADAHNNLGVAFVAQGRMIDAIAHYKRAIALNPDHRNAHNNLGTALVSLLRFAEAIPHYERAIALNPGQADAHYNLGIALAGDGRIDEAILRYQKALFLKRDYAEAHNNLGNLLATQGKTEAAIGHYERALAGNPNHANSLNNLGNAYRDLGQFEKAMELYDRAIAIRPASAEAHYNRAEIKTFRRGESDLDAMRELGRRRDLPLAKTPFVHFALAKALEDIGDYTGSFEHLRLGNEAKRSQIYYDERGTSALFQSVTKAFDAELMERLSGGGHPSEAPVFVLGMPRSGSSLIEQILASHPQIHGAGEREDLAECLPKDFPQSMAEMSLAEMRKIGEAYVARMVPLMSGKGAEGRVRVVNKLPDNFLRIGLIKLALPNARIIHTTRNPMDTCLSCYSKLFTTGLNYTYELGELGRYFRRYSALMEHWRTVLPEASMLEVSYEDVVDDLEGQARRLVEYCGLPWDDRCLSFHTTRRTVKTASAVQVRKPLFRTSLERWRRFEAGLKPLMKEIGEPAAASFGAAC